MNWWEQFCLGFKDVLNQPIPIIGFTIGSFLFFVLVIISKTSIGKKALNTLKSKIDVAENKLANAERKLTDSNKYFDNYKALKEQEINELKEHYETQLSGFKSELYKQNEMIKILCENSVNKNVKSAYENYSKELVELTDSEIVRNAIVDTECKYDSKLSELEDKIKELVEHYGRENN